MTELLKNRLRHVRQRVRKTLWLHGMSWLVAVVFSAVFVVGFVDWLVHLDDPRVRLILALVIVGLGSLISWRFLIAPLLVSLSDVELASKVEQRFPGFRDSLSSTVEFLQNETDPRSGSPDLQQCVIEGTLTELDRVDVVDVVETRNVLRMVAIAVCVCLVMAIVISLNRVEAEMAVNRLVFPFAENPWPKTIHLRLVDARMEPITVRLQIARGDTLEVFVVNTKGTLPANVVMEYRFDDGQVISESLRKTTLRDRQGRNREVCAATLMVVKGPMQFRACGGDHRDMLWYSLHVVPPPLVDDLRVTLTPPAYSNQSIVQLPIGIGHIKGLVGTNVDIRATVNNPLMSATLRVQDSEIGTIEISEDQRSFFASFQICEAGVYSYWFALKDQQGFENSEAPRYEVRGIVDVVPDVYIDKPATDVQLTADANLPLRIVAKDDLGLNDVRLHYKFSDSKDDSGVLMSLPFDGKRPKQVAIDHKWELAPLKLELGMRLTFRAEANDDFNLESEHVGRSISRTITIVSQDMKVAELAARQAAILEELEQIGETQRYACDQVGELQVQLQTVGRLRAEDVDTVKRVELKQRQISSRLLGSTDGVEARAWKLLDEITSNHIDDQESKCRLNMIADELADLRNELLPAIEQELTQARKLALSSEPAVRNDTATALQRSQTGRNSARARSQDAAEEHGSKSSRSQDKSRHRETVQAKSDNVKNRSIVFTIRLPTESRDLSDSLETVEEHQTAVLDSLNEMLAWLLEWQNQRNLDNHLNEVIVTQEAINRNTAEIGKQRLLNPLDTPSSQQQADLTKLRDRQRQQAAQLEKFRKQLGNTADIFGKSDPDGADSLNEAVEQLDRNATYGRMREAADLLDKEFVGESINLQQRILKELKDLEDILRNRLVTDTEQLIKQLKRAEEKLESLKDSQYELLRTARDVDQEPDSRQRKLEFKNLKRKQQKLRQEVSDLARRLRRLQVGIARDSARCAVSHMQQAEEAFSKDDSRNANVNQQEALNDLIQAQRELAWTCRDVEKSLIQEQMERIGDELKGMIARQQDVIDETIRIDAAHAQRIKRENKASDSWQRSETKSLRNLADVQRGLKDETDHLAESLKAADVFALALRGASQSMQVVAQRLQQRYPDAHTVAVERVVKQRFIDLIDALNPEKGGNTIVPGASEQSQGPQAHGFSKLAQLKMLKILQEDLNRRTTELDELLRLKINISDEEFRKVKRLADEQKQLADLARNMAPVLVDEF